MSGAGQSNTRHDSESQAARVPRMALAVTIEFIRGPAHLLLPVHPYRSLAVAKDIFLTNARRLRYAIRQPACRSGFTHRSMFRCGNASTHLLQVVVIHGSSWL